MDVLKELAEAIILGQAQKAEELTHKALEEEGLEPGVVLNQGLIAGMNVVGEKFKNNEYYVPEVLIAARAMKAGLKVLRPRLAETGVKPVAKLVIGTVKGDLHDIGKNLVSMMMEGAGFEVIDLGVDAGPDKFVQAVENDAPHLIGMSALLTTTMLNMKSVIEELEKKGVRERVKVIIGGAPVTESYAQEIGADGYAPDAATAVEVAKALLNLN